MILFGLMFCLPGPPRWWPHRQSPGKQPRPVELRRWPWPQAWAWQVLSSDTLDVSSRVHFLCFAIWTGWGFSKPFSSVFYFCIIIPSSIYFYPLTFYYKQQGETRSCFNISLEISSAKYPSLSLTSSTFHPTEHNQPILPLHYKYPFPPVSSNMFFISVRELRKNGL